MLDKLKQARRMWENGKTHGEIKEVTELSHEVEYAVTLPDVTLEKVFAKLPSIKSGMKAAEIETIVKG